VLRRHVTAEGHRAKKTWWRQDIALLSSALVAAQFSQGASGTFMVPKKAATLALKSATPHAVIDAIGKGEAQTREPYGAVNAHVLR